MRGLLHSWPFIRLLAAGATCLLIAAEIVSAQQISQRAPEEAKNPNTGEEAALRDPREILAEIAALDAETAEILGMSKRAFEREWTLTRRWLREEIG